MAVENVYYLDCDSRNIVKTNKNGSLTIVENIESFETTDVYINFQSSSTTFYLFGNNGTILKRSKADVAGVWTTILNNSTENALVALPPDYFYYELEAKEYKYRSPIVTANNKIYVAYIGRHNVNLDVDITFVVYYDGTSWTKILDAPSEHFVGWVDLNSTLNLVGLKTSEVEVAPHFTREQQPNSQEYHNCNKFRMYSGVTVTNIPVPTTLQRPLLTKTHDAPITGVAFATGLNHYGNIQTGKLSEDGMLWSVLTDHTGTQEYLIRVNPITNDTAVFDLPVKYGAYTYIGICVTGNYVILSSMSWPYSGLVLFEVYNATTGLVVHSDITNAGITELQNFCIDSTGDGKAILTFIAWNSTPSVFSIDAAAGTITAKGNSPIVMLYGNSYKALLPNGNLFFGTTGAGGRTIYIYTPSTDTWITQTDALPAIAGAGRSILIEAPGHAWDGFVLLIGNNVPSGTTFIVYDPATATIVSQQSIDWSEGGYGVGAGNLYNYGQTFTKAAFNFPNIYYAESNAQDIEVVNIETNTLTRIPLDLPYDVMMYVTNYNSALIVKDANTLTMPNFSIKTTRIDWYVPADHTQGYNDVDETAFYKSYDISLTLKEPAMNFANIQAITAVSVNELYCATVGASHADWDWQTNAYLPDNKLVATYGDSPNPTLYIYKWNGSAWSEIRTISNPLYNWTGHTGNNGGEFGDPVDMPYTPLLMCNKLVAVDPLFPNVKTPELVMLRDTIDSLFKYDCATDTLTVDPAYVPPGGGDNEWEGGVAPSIPYVYNKDLASSVSSSYNSWAGSYHQYRNELEVFAEARLCYKPEKDLYWLARVTQPAFIITVEDGPLTYAKANTTLYQTLPIINDFVNPNAIIQIRLDPTVILSGKVIPTIETHVASEIRIKYEIAADISTDLSEYIYFEVATLGSQWTSPAVQRSLFQVTIPATPTSGKMAILNNYGIADVSNSRIYASGGGVNSSSDGVTWTIDPVVVPGTLNWNSTYYNYYALNGVCANSPAGMIALGGMAGIQKPNSYWETVSFSVPNINQWDIIDPTYFNFRPREIFKMSHDGVRYITIASNIDGEGSVGVATSPDLITWTAYDYDWSNMPNGDSSIGLLSSGGTTILCDGSWVQRINAAGEFSSCNIPTGFSPWVFRVASDGAGNWLISSGTDEVCYSTNDGVDFTAIDLAKFGNSPANNKLSVAYANGKFFVFTEATAGLETASSPTVDFAGTVTKHTATSIPDEFDVKALGSRLIRISPETGCKYSINDGTTWI